MKKKIAITLIVVLLIGTMVGVLTGCDEIFKKNNDRDLNQVVASVEYGGQTTNVYKHELIDSFNSYAYIYVNYYGMSYEAAADTIIKDLAKRELLVLFAEEYIAKENSKIANEKIEPSAMSLVYNANNPNYSFLNKAEYNKAIEDTNKSLLDALSELVKQAIFEDKANAGDTNDDDDDDIFTGKVEHPVFINFDSRQGSAVPDKTVERGQRTFEPTAPTKAGYTFYGWEDVNGNLIDWKTFRPSPEKGDTIKLYARWVETTAPRTERPKAEKAEEEFDPDIDPEKVTISNKFFDDEYIKDIDFSDKDFVKDIILEKDETLDDKLDEYIQDGISTLTRNISKQNKSYDYFLEGQMKTLVLNKFQRLLDKEIEKNNLNEDKQANEAFQKEINNKFQEMVSNNKETFGDNGADFANSFKSANATLASHVYKKVNNVNYGYGFVHNILMKLPQEDVDTLFDLRKDSSQAYTTKVLNQMIDNMLVKVANPDYDADAKTYKTKVDEQGKEVLDKASDPIQLKDPMTDPLNPYNNVGENKSTFYNKDNNFDRIVGFEWVEAKDDEPAGYQVVFGVKEAPAMAYTMGNFKAFTKGKPMKKDAQGTLTEVKTANTIGIVEQIYNSIEEVYAVVEATKTLEDTDPKKLTMPQAIYWVREVSTAWLYLVGDDSGSLNTESNNGGLGYLVNPEGEESGFLEGFTAQARALIKKGTGSHYTADESASYEEKVKSSYKVDNNFIFEDGKVMPDKAQAYAGVFVLVATQTSYVPEDTEGEDGFYAAEVGENYYVQYGKDAKDCLTAKQKLQNDMLAAKKSANYSENTKAFETEHEGNIQYNKKAYESLYKDLK